jgi:hypothetical protein
MRWELEELARLALERADISAPVNAAQLARRLGFTVYHAPDCLGLLVGRGIYVDDALRAERRHFSIAHELGHALQREAGLPDTERSADYLASALLLPKDDFDRDLRKRGWDLLALHARHRWASFEAIARRIVALREARAFVFDRPLQGQDAPRWYSVPWGLRPSHDEVVAAEEAFLCGAPVEVVAGVTGWPVIQHDWARAITVAAL